MAYLLRNFQLVQISAPALSVQAISRSTELHYSFIAASDIFEDMLRSFQIYDFLHWITLTSFHAENCL